MTSDKDYFDKVREFHEHFSHTLGEWPPSVPTYKLRLDLIDEEFTELWNEFIFGELDKVKIAKELADLLYVVFGAAVAFGIPIKEVFDEVHKSNMSKLGEDGKPEYRSDGKVMKGPNYQPPQLEFIFK
jgi:predicted HAD superfamily Cof-like phosphohydrolase